MIEEIKLNEHIRVLFRYANGTLSLLPLGLSDKFMLCAIDDIFMFDGFTIRKIEDIDEIHINMKYREMLKEEKVFDNIETPDIKLDSWKEIFNSLYALDENIIIECNNSSEDGFFIGRIEKVMDYGITFRSFNTHGEWDKEAEVISYAHISNVTFKSRYINVFSKYLS